MNESRLFEQFQCYGRRPDREGNETVLTLSRAIGEGYRREIPQGDTAGRYRWEIPLGPGLKLYLEHYTLKEQLSARVVPEKCPLGISLCISGRLNWIPDRPGPVPAYRTLPGQFDISVSGSDMDDGFIECMPHEPIRLISLLIEPDRLPCRAVHADIMESLPFASPASRTQLFSYMKHHLNPSMDMAARQLMNCRLTGTSKTFYLTAKSLEIIALAMGSLENASTFLSALPPGHGRRVGSREKEALCQVRHILDQQYPDPPSLAQLARQTGLNQTKLKKGFKLLFNTTISSYVLTRRMEKGHDLLKKGETTVSEVAYKVGYANRAHFTRAFTRQFGYPPVDLLRHDLRDNPGDSV